MKRPNKEGTYKYGYTSRLEEYCDYLEKLLFILNKRNVNVSSLKFSISFFKKEPEKTRIEMYNMLNKLENQHLFPLEYTALEKWLEASE